METPLRRLMIIVDVFRLLSEIFKPGAAVGNYRSSRSHVFVKLRRIDYTMVASNRDCLDVGRTGWCEVLNVEYF